MTSSAGHQHLSRELLKFDEGHKNPRVFIVSLAWAFATHLKDHKFILTKHDNDTFEVSQNYIKGKSRQSMSLSDWQKSSSSAFSSGHFNRSVCCQLLASLGAFANNSRFDAKNFASIFGVEHTRGSGDPVSTSISHREISDDAIIGCGLRDFSESLLLMAGSQDQEIPKITG
jgi:hypothetical protein